jgi:hypothetical protein
MAHAHYVVLFAGLMFRKNHATKHRAPGAEPAESVMRIADVWRTSPIGEVDLRKQIG